MDANELREAGSVWLRDEPARKRRATPLSRERIVTEAVALLDEHGTAKLTMRRLAESLEVTPTALYWHVKTKDDVLDLAEDHVFGEVVLPEPGEDWRHDVRTLIRRWHSAMARHPWSTELIGRPALGPNVLARTEFLQSALTRGGFAGLELAVATRVLANFVIGAALTEATWRRSGDPVTRADARRHVEAHRERYPTLAASGHLDDGRWSDEELFDRGLDVLLAGLPQTVVTTMDTATSASRPT
ncbi:TetR/AcrR family transcriptional regulator [Prauserella cavernicola]|uniref:TetR/AcrR family transcriptional regulator n=1 Tax=Prauserella cavernicola TaxID=2800127 RepID=UPI0027DB30D6|nr:TetR/AcrR family transcriptional regulator [Prauserella cavernicola]